MDRCHLQPAELVLLVHLIEPFLSLTPSSQTTWEKLQESFPVLYSDLKNVKPELLLDLTSPGLSFVSPERFKSCLPPSELLQPVEELIEENRQEVKDLLKILLPKLADAWELQRGKYFGFGEKESSVSDMEIAEMDLDQTKTETKTKTKTNSKSKTNTKKSKKSKENQKKFK